jgi:hypothetical protein
MKRKISAALVVMAAPALTGCAVQAALAAAELAKYVPEPERTSNAQYKPAATEACSQRAAQYGSVYVLDVQQRRADEFIVWGSVTDAQQHRRTFECHFTTKLTAFKLREIGG